jgi:hypothetical protein
MDIVAAERGKFFFDREGKAIFWNRHHLLKKVSASATFNNSMVEIAYTYAGQDICKNDIFVNCHPRKLGDSADEVLWELDSGAIKVAAGETREMYVKYKDDNDNRVGGKDVTVGDLEFDRGSATASVEAKANGAELTFTNSGSVDAIITACKVKGRKITDFGQMEAIARDGVSQGKYGKRTLKINLPSIDDLDEAQRIADFELNRRTDPSGTVISLSDHHADQLTLTIGDLVTVQESQSAHGRDYFVVGETHKLVNGAELYTTTWFLEPAPDTYPWALGVTGCAELGETTYLTY